MKCSLCNGTGWDEEIKMKCYYCHGTGEVEMTNFDNIAKNEDTLAKWLSDKIHFCKFVSCDECTAYVSEDECKDVTNADLWSTWLKQIHTKEQQNEYM